MLHALHLSGETTETSTDRSPFATIGVQDIHILGGLIQNRNAILKDSQNTSNIHINHDH